MTVHSNTSRQFSVLYICSRSLRSLDVIAGMTRNVIGNLERSNHETARSHRLYVLKYVTLCSIARAARSLTPCTSGCACALVGSEATILKLCLESLHRKKMWIFPHLRRCLPVKQQTTWWTELPRIDTMYVYCSNYFYKRVTCILNAVCPRRRGVSPAQWTVSCQHGVWSG